MFVTDFTEYYESRIIDTEVLGKYAGGPYGGGPNAEPPNHTKSEILPDTLVGVPLATLSSIQLSTFKVLRAVSDVECEGFFDGINCWDNQTVSIPLHHGSLGRPGDEGELGALIDFLATNNRPGYDKAFATFGLLPLNEIFGVSSRRFVAQVALTSVSGGNVVDTRNEFNYLKSWHWFYRWVMAGRSVPEYRRSLYAFGARRLKMMLESEWTAALHFDDGSGQRAARIGDVFTSERAVALLLRWHVNMPGHVVRGGRAAEPIRRALQEARSNAAGLFSGANVHLWSATTEDALVDGLLKACDETPGGPESSTMDPVAKWPSWTIANNPRGYALPVSIGRLDTARHSFQLDNP